MKNLIAFLLLIIFTTLSSVAFARNDECFECHQELSNKVKHLAAVINCNLCHTDHDVGIAKRYPYRLKKPVVKMCQTCHIGYTVGHIQGNHAKNGVGKYDPLYPENAFTCVTCHNPHQSKMPKLIRYDYSKETSPYNGEVCALCHAGKYGLPENLKTPPRNAYGDPMEENTPTEVRTYKMSQLSEGQNYFDVAISSRLFSGFRYTISKNGKVIIDLKVKTMPSVTQILTDISKSANDGDLVRLSAQDYAGPIQVGIAPVKQLIVEVFGNAGEANISCPAKKDCVKASGKLSNLRGLKISNTSEDLFSFTEDSKREFILIMEDNVPEAKSKFRFIVIQK